MAITSTIVTAAASPIYIDANPVQAPATVMAVPGGGGTLSIAYSTTPGAAALGAGATWVVWPSGTVGVATSMTLASPVQGIRATASGATGTVEISG